MFMSKYQLEDLFPSFMIKLMQVSLKRMRYRKISFQCLQLTAVHIQAFLLLLATVKLTIAEYKKSSPSKQNTTTYAGLANYCIFINIHITINFK